MAMRSIAQRMLQIAGRRDHKFQSFAAISSDSRSLAPAIDLKVDPVSSASAAAASSSSDWATSMEICGRGDKKTKRGKRFKGSFGNARPKMKKKIERIKDKLEVPRSTPWPLPFKLI